MPYFGAINPWQRMLDFYRGTVIHIRWFPSLILMAVILALLGLLIRKR